MKKFIFLGAFLFSAIGFAAVGDHYTTDYLSKYGQYTIHVVNQDNVTIAVDPNTCGLSNLGEPTMCTEMAGQFLKGKFVMSTFPTNRRTTSMEFTGGPYRFVTVLKGFNPIRHEYFLLLKGREGKVLDRLRLVKLEVR